MSQAKQNVAAHRHLVCAEILYFVVGEEEKGVCTTRLNTLIATADGVILKKHIGQAQYAVQMQLNRQVGEEVQLNVVNVIITSISYLGISTPDEFNGGTTEKELEAQKEAIAKHIFG